MQQNNSAPAAEDGFDRRYAYKVLVVFAFFAIAVMYIETMLLPSLPAIESQFKVDSAQVTLILSMYLVFGIAMNPVIGKLGDIYGKKKMLTYVLPVYLVAAATTSFSPNFTFMVASRTIQGIGLTLFPLISSLIREQFPRDLVPKAQGMISAMFGAGSVIGLPLGAYISNSFGWQATYHTALPFLLVFTAMAFIVVRESKFTRPYVLLDYVGAAMMGIGLASVILALSNGPYLGWNSSLVLSLLTFGIVFLVGLFIYERKKVEPILDLVLLKHKNVAIANFLSFATGLSLFLANQALSFKFELPSPAGFGLSIFQTGVSLLPYAVMSAIIAIPIGFYISKEGLKPFIYAGAILSAFGFGFAAFSSAYINFIISSAIFGTGLAMINVPAINLLVLSIDEHKMGLATSMNTVFRSTGSSLGAPIAGSILSTFTVSSMYGALPSSNAFHFIFLIATAFCIMAGILSIFAIELFHKGDTVKR